MLLLLASKLHCDQQQPGTKVPPLHVIQEPVTAMRKVKLLEWQSQVVVIALSHDGRDVHEQDLAATPKDSRERFEARRLLPGMAKRIREVCRSPPEFRVTVSRAKPPLISTLHADSKASHVY